MTDAARGVLTGREEWLSWPAPADIVVGESYYMGALLDIAGRPRAQGWHVPVEITLQREPDGWYGHEAVAVLADGEKVGHISAQICEQFAEAMDLAGRRKITGIPGLVRGAWPGKPNLGVLIWVHGDELGPALPGVDLDEIREEFPARGWPPGLTPHQAEAHQGKVSTGAGGARPRPVAREPRTPPLYRHFSDYVEDVKELKRRGRLEDAETLLTALITAVEAESDTEGTGVAPWYYEQLAIVRRKRADLAGEIEILERFMGRRHAPGAGPTRLKDRLRRARDRQAGSRLG